MQCVRWCFRDFIVVCKPVLVTETRSRCFPRSLAVLRACACCLEIHKRLFRFSPYEGVELSLHIGLATPATHAIMTTLSIEGRRNSVSYVYVGYSLTALGAEKRIHFINFELSVDNDALLQVLKV